MVSSDSNQSAKGYWAAVILNLEQCAELSKNDDDIKKYHNRG